MVVILTFKFAVSKVELWVVTKEVPSLAYLPYLFGSNLIEEVIVNGEFNNEN